MTCWQQLSLGMGHAWAMHGMQYLHVAACKGLACRCLQGPGMLAVWPPCSDNAGLKAYRLVQHTNITGHLLATVEQCFTAHT